MDHNQDLDNVINSDSQDTEDTTVDETEDTKAEDADISAKDENSLPEDQPVSKKLVILSSIYDYVEIFAVAIVAVLFIFTFCARLCRVDGSSMKQTLNHEEMLITTNLFYTPQQGDIIVFHLSNDYYQEPLVKRVIATEGQIVEINLTSGVLKVDGEVYDDEHAYLSGGQYDLRLDFNKNYVYKANGNTYFAATVPKGCVFVLGDNRNGSSDSRTARVGFVDVDTILGKAVIKLSPFTVLD